MPVLAALLATVLAGCTDERWSRDDSVRISESPIESGRHRVELVGTIQPPSGTAAELIEPSDLEWLSNGEIVVADYKPAMLKVYGPDGALLRTIGAEGDGPGEFREPVLAARDSVIAVLDLFTGRLTSFRVSDGQVIGETQGTIGIPASPFLTADGRFMQRVSRVMDPPTYVRIHRVTGSTDSITLPDVVEGGLPERETTWIISYQPPGGRTVPIRVPIPLGPRYLAAPLDGGGWLSAWTGAYRISVLDSTLATRFVFGREVSPSTVNGAQKDSLISRALQRFRMFGPEEELRKGIDASMIPDEWPVISEVHVDGRGRFWVRLPANGVSESDSLTIDLFAPDGTWLDQFRLPAALWPVPPHDPIFRGDDMLLMQRDDEGFPLIRIVRLAGPEG